MPEFLNDPVLAARIQFAANITFHILFTALSIALSWMLLYASGLATAFLIAGVSAWRWPRCCSV